VSERVEQFTTRWGMIVAMLGMAVGTGNIWRFPRVAATNGGGSFLVAWFVFLLLWSIPLILVEFAMGKGTRTGNVGAFAKIMGRSYAWMGAWVAWTATAIMFYYAVVTGWTIRYSWAAISGELRTVESAALWDAFSFSWSVVGFQALALAIGVFIVARGVRGIEYAARILIPSLFVLVVVLAIRAVTLPGAVDGLNFLFTPSWEGLADPSVWLAALTQNAWDTGAGWGLILTYAIYLRRREDTALNAFVIGFGNNTVSLLAGIMVLCTIFSLMPDAADQIVGAGNEGLTFIWVPQLFALMPGGAFFMVIFFVALFFAAISSLIAMIELATRVLRDLGIPRSRAIILVGGAGLLLGIPSAINGGVFNNQDFVWGVGLMMSGLFFASAVLRYGVRRFRETFINTGHSDIHIGAWWDWAIRLVVVQALVLIVWWFWQVRTEDPWGAFGWANMVAQWVVAIAFFAAFNGWLAGRTEKVAAAQAEGNALAP
jgi:neurotransmitter:Na+ symporter, NSS family